MNEIIVTGLVNRGSVEGESERETRSLGSVVAQI